MLEIIIFSDLEQADFRSTLDKRWPKGEVDVQLVDVDVTLSDTTKGNIECPAYYWEYAEYHFLLMKTGKNKFRPQFFFQDTEEVEAETLEFDDVAECTMALLQLQANHALSLKMKDEDA